MLVGTFLSFITLAAIGYVGIYKVAGHADNVYGLITIVGMLGSILTGIVAAFASVFQLIGMIL